MCLILFDRYRKRNGTAKFAPIAFLNVPVGRIGVVATRECAANRQDAITDADIKVFLIYSSSTSLNDKCICGFVDVNCELSWKIIISLFPRVV